ncbi:rhamnan synthesis F family protein [Avibacterium sp. 21-599]|uniref:rhamnan synthesis F family protein n=1 Tax=Avibacterium sp. 21-599 TaxID=2911528 RepID=UPI0022451687|nr:rhamnan synthesis F family protein [Avibacterium sp. 21-599]MCW9718781.1 rhamnan synthesis F family protein [Avibacterium sp. 21-599]
MLKKLVKILKGKFISNLILLLLVKERYLVKRAAKKYKKNNPNGTIKLLSIFENFDYSSLNDKDIILFVVYNPKSLLMYERYFSLLEKLNYEIIVISNGNLPESFISNFKDKTLFMAERKNIGRDFGAYKEFILFLNQNNIKLRNLVICNDSIFANLKEEDLSFVNFFKSHQDDDFLGACDYFGKSGYHVQSYFLKFSHNVLKGKNFINFWTNFLVSDDRRHNINNGEIKLSQSILKDGFKPTIFLSTDNIINKIVDNKEVLTKFLIETSANKHLDPNIISRLKKLSLGLYNKKFTSEHIAYYNACLKQEISRLIDEFGMIVVCPFLIVDEFGFPFLKRDIVYRKITEWMLIRNFGKSFDKDLLDEYISEQRIRIRAWHINSFKQKLMYHIGMN